jgi:hypothetical protein
MSVPIFRVIDGQIPHFSWKFNMADILRWRLYQDGSQWAQKDHKRTQRTQKHVYTYFQSD